MSSGGRIRLGFSSPWETYCPHTWMTRGARTSQVRTAQRPAGLGLHRALRATPPTSQGGGGGPRVKARVAAGTGQTLTLPLNLFLSVWTALPGPSVCSLPPLRSQGPNFSTGTCSPWSPAWPEPYTYSLDRVAKGSRPHPSQQRPKPNLYSGFCPTQSDLPDSPLSCLVPSRPGFSSGTRG